MTSPAPWAWLQNRGLERTLAPLPPAPYLPGKVGEGAVGVLECGHAATQMGTPITTVAAVTSVPGSRSGAMSSAERHCPEGQEGVCALRRQEPSVGQVHWNSRGE